MKLPRLARLAVPLVITRALTPPAYAYSLVTLPALESLFRAQPVRATPNEAKPRTPRTRPHEVRRRPPLPPRATASHYIRSVDPQVLRVRGCHSGRVRTFGIVILDFGRLGYNGHSYGTLTFAGRFATNRAITRAMQAFARGYVRCLPAHSRAHIVLAPGTSNYSPHVPSTFEAGRRWARETVGFARFLRSAGLNGRLRSAAADDVEPAWDPSFHRTRDFFRVYRDYEPGYPLYNYGSLDGRVGQTWNARQAWYVTGGMRYARPIPEIYYPVMARQWAELSRIVARRFRRRLAFAGLMTQHWNGCFRCGYRPHEAHRALMSALPPALRRQISRLPAPTNIR